LDIETATTWGASDPFVNLHLGAEIRSFIVANLVNRPTITPDLRYESAHFTHQSASSGGNSETP
jgi:hypothetical protein